MNIWIRESEKNGNRRIDVIDLTSIDNRSITVRSDDKNIDFDKFSEVANRIAKNGGNFDDVENYYNDNIAIDPYEEIRNELGISIAENGDVTIEGEDVVFPHEFAGIFREMTTLEQGKRLVKFAKRLAKNPHKHSIESLIEWIKANPSLSILEDGRIRGFRGNDQNLLSNHAGYGIIIRPGCEPEEINGKHDNSPGNIIKFPFYMADHNPHNICSVGLHVGTKEYAHGFGVRWVTVAFAPEHVISFPNDGTSYKIRVTEFEVLEEVSKDYMRDIDRP